MCRPGLFVGIYSIMGVGTIAANQNRNYIDIFIYLV